MDFQCDGVEISHESIVLYFVFNTAMCDDKHDPANENQEYVDVKVENEETCESCSLEPPSD